MSAPSYPTVHAARGRRLRHLLLVVLLLLLVPGLIAGAGATGRPGAAVPPAGTAPQGDLSFRLERLSGADRYATAVTISREFFDPGVPVALVATGENFPDGLAAGPIGDQLGGPVLFTRQDSLPASTRGELTRLRPARIIVVGGPAAISETVRTQLDGLTAGPATRMAGDDRYGTAAVLSRHAFPGGATVAYVATGVRFPDALAGGAAAGVQTAPLLLTASGRLPDTTRAELRRVDPDRILLIGGTGSVSEAVRAELAGIATTERVSGSDRYQTALAVSRRVFGVDRPGLMVATGQNWPDALAAVPGTRTTRGPVLLAIGNSLPYGSRVELQRLSPRTAYLLGGTAAVGRDVAASTQRYLGVCWSGDRPSPGGQEVFDRVPGATGKIAFTLDMGGRMDPAMDIVEYLAEHQVCTTFFPTGIMSDTAEGREVLAFIGEHSHLFELGNHTVHHCDLVSGGGGSPTLAPCRRDMTASFIRSELTGAELTLQRRSGGMPVTPYWRPPYGSHNTFVRNTAAQVDYTKTVMWNRDTIDWHPDTTTQQIVNRVTSPRPPAGTIVLAHLGGYRTLDALPQIVSILRADGYTFTTVSDLRDG